LHTCILLLITSATEDVFVVVCLLATLRKNFRCIKFSGKVGNEPMNKRLNFGGDPDHRLDTGLFSGFVTIGRYRKWLTHINLLLILFR